MLQKKTIITRVHGSFLASTEKQLLRALATRVPQAIMPDHLTLLGIFGAALCGLSYAASVVSPVFLWLASLGLVVNWLGDSLDGTLARHRRIERPRYGFFIDHTTDVASQALIFLGLGTSPYLRFDIACLTLMSYWLAALYTFIRALVTDVFQISYGGFGPTEIRLGLITYNLALLAVGSIVVETGFGAVSPLDLICVAIFIVVFITFPILTWREGRRLAKLDALPPDTRSQKETTIP